jgi:YVTN family beta-propeller protein
MSGMALRTGNWASLRAKRLCAAAIAVGVLVEIRADPRPARDLEQRGQSPSWRWRSAIIAVLLSMMGAMATMVATSSVAAAQTLTPFAYVPATHSPAVSVINTSTNTVTTVNVGEEVSGGVAITPNGEFAYVTDEGAPGVASVISTSTNAVVATVPELSPNGEVPSGIAITPNGEFAYVTQQGNHGGSISVINTSTNTIVATLPVVGAQPIDVAITPNGEFAYITDSTLSQSSEGSVLVVNTSTNTVVATVPVGNLPADGIAITPNGEFAYVPGGACADGGTENCVSVIGTSTNTVVATVAVGSDDSQDIAITPNGEFAYVTNINNAAVSVINTSTNTVATTVSLLPELYSSGVAFTPDGTLAYVENDGVSVINTSTNTVVATIAEAGNGIVGDIAITPPIVGPETPITVPMSTPIITPVVVPITPPAAPKVKVTPKAISAAVAFSLPPAKQCVSKRKFTIHVRTLPGITWVSAVIKINHKPIKTLKRSRIAALVNLRGFPKGTFVLSITAKASNGQSVTGTRTYHTCVPKSKSHYAAPRL